GACQRLHKNTFTDAEVAKLLTEKYNPVKFHAEANETSVFSGKPHTNPNYVEARKNSRDGLHEFGGVIGVSAYPTMKVLDASGKATKNIVGYRNAQQLLAEL